jgi:hypothetical protein
LPDAIADAYRAFGRYREPLLPLDVCIACCVSEKTEKQLREWPLKRLTARHFYEYNSSAKSHEQDPREVGHFVPRMLDLLAEGEEIHHSIELSLDRLGRCPQDSWTQQQHAALSRYALAYFDLVLCGAPMGASGRRLKDDPLSVVLMFDIGALDTEPLLTHWLHCENPYSTIQFVQTTYWDFWEDCDYSNAFASDRPDFRQRIRAWLLHPEHRKRFAAKMLSTDFLAQAEAQPSTGHTSFSTMIDGVFAQLTQ